MAKRDTILIVDDMEINRAILRDVFEDTYNILETDNGEHALLLVSQCHENIAAILLDIVMPAMDGYQVMKKLNENSYLDEIPVIIITAENSSETEINAFDLGASDIIMKPFEPHVIKRRVKNIIELNLHRLNLNEIIDEQTKELEKSNSAIITALSSVIEYRSQETGQHVQRMGLFTKILLEDIAANYPEYMLNDHKINLISNAAYMHDIGKIAIPDAILNKPGRLTDEEFAIMKTHTVKGCEILSRIEGMSDHEYMQYAFNICRFHHERFDGRGYPDGLKGEAIPICAQAVGIADCYDALTNDRVYKKAIPAEQATNMISNGECGIFSPKMLDSLKNVKEDFFRFTNDYADNKQSVSNKIKAVPHTLPQAEQQSSFLSEQLKYYTLLKYINANVMELDPDSGTYQLVYSSENIFNILKTGNSFKNTIRLFAEEAVHPDDRAAVLELVGNYTDEFFKNGFLSKKKSYRILDPVDGSYHEYSATMLKTNTTSPNKHNLLIIWQRPDKSTTNMPSVDSDDYAIFKKILSDTQICRNDNKLYMDKISSSLCILSGYTKEEIAGIFHSNLIEMVYPDDRIPTLKNINTQLNSGFLLNFEFRLITKSGKTAWILAKSNLIKKDNGDDLLASVLVDITDSKKVQENLRSVMERYQLVMEQTKDIIFEWNIKSDKISYSSNIKAKLGFIPVNTGTNILHAPHIHPKDIQHFEKFVNSVRHNTHYIETEMRIADVTGHYRWYRIKVMSKCEDGPESLTVVGIISDIDDERRSSLELLKRAECDSLTKLYNKATAVEKINKYISEEENPAGVLLIIDIDDFKLINDTYGHMLGDIVIQEISARLKNMFYGSDIISRIGGDEFMIFMKDIHNRQLVADRAKRVNDAFLSIVADKVNECTPSCSIGIAFYPDDGSSFDTLFNCADMALYHAKLNGKDCFAFYDIDFADNVPDAMKAATKTKIESDILPQSLEPPLLDYILTAFANPQSNPDDMINGVLRVIGEHYSLSRTYVFENTADDSAADNTYEWCNENITPQLANLRNVPYSVNGISMLDSFDSSGIFYCHNTENLPEWEHEKLSSQGIKSILLCAMLIDGKMKGYVGFDDCKINRIWVSDQIRMLSFITKFIGLLLYNKRTAEQCGIRRRKFETILESQPQLVYVTDPNSLNLLYSNKANEKIDIDAPKKVPCYRMIYGRNEQCEDCPFKNSDSKKKASKINWDGTDAYLITE